MTGYGQFCPVSKAMELLDERWTMLVVRELLLGSKHFNELRRGVPKMSPALLSKRLKSLTRAGVVERLEVDGRTAYSLTQCGQELGEVVDALGRWGVRWIGELGEEDLDPHHCCGTSTAPSPSMRGRGRAPPSRSTSTG
jgi:DNA-binding HxlR family transcriptional regulator